MKTYGILSGQERNEIWDFALFIGLFIALNPITTFGTSDMILILATMMITFYVFILKKDKLDNILIWVLIYWCMVNFFSFLFLSEPGTSFSIKTFVGSLLKIFIGYGFMKLCGIRFIVWYYRVVLVLAIISIPFFLVQLVQPSIFNSIPVNFAASIRAMDGHWNGLIFNYSTYHIDQNSGFAGEPGTFGYYIGLAMIFNLILNNGKINRNFIILALIGATTFSTTYYLTLVLFGLFFLSSASWITKIFYLVFCIFFGSAAYQLPFIGDKIDTYVNDTESMVQSELVKSKRVNRMATFVNHLTDVAQFPIGYGINEAGRTKNIYGMVIDGTNGFSRIALRWGIYGLIYFMIIYFKLFDKLNKGVSGSTLFTIIVLMYISANPMERDYFAMALFWLYFMFSSDEVTRLVQSWGKEGEDEQLTFSL